MTRLVVLILTISIISACSSDVTGVSEFSPRIWQGIEIKIESRPQPMRPGMNEMLIVATDARGLPASEMVVSLRMRQSGKWHQAIQDGGSGVYRRALLMRPGDQQVFVRLQKGRHDDVLTYPLMGHRGRTTTPD